MRQEKDAIGGGAHICQLQCELLGQHGEADYLDDPQESQHRLQAALVCLGTDMIQGALFRPEHAWDAEHACLDCRVNM